MQNILTWIDLGGPRVQREKKRGPIGSPKGYQKSIEKRIEKRMRKRRDKEGPKGVGPPCDNLLASKSGGVRPRQWIQDPCNQRETKGE